MQWSSLVGNGAAAGAVLSIVAVASIHQGRDLGTPYGMRVTKAWVIRAGRNGERDQWALDNGYSGGGWKEFPDLTPYTTREQIAEVTAATLLGAPQGRLNTAAGQLWALRARIGAGDLLVMPLKTTKQIAMGWITDGYRYLGDDQPADCRHVVTVDWKTADIPWTVVKQDLLYTLGSAISIFASSKNNAVARLKHLLHHGSAPGAATSEAPAHLRSLSTSSMDPCPCSRFSKSGAGRPSNSRSLPILSARAT